MLPVNLVSAYWGFRQ